MPISAEVLGKYAYNDVLIETGTGGGAGIRAALEAGFKHVVSIEALLSSFNKATGMFRHYKNVTLLYGDSAHMLRRLVLKQLQKEATFWLDAHASGQVRKGIDPCPLLRELAEIAKHPIKTHTILIDDRRIFEEGISKWHNIMEKDINKALLTINPMYKFSYEDGHAQRDIIVAQPREQEDGSEGTD